MSFKIIPMTIFMELCTTYRDLCLKIHVRIRRILYGLFHGFLPIPHASCHHFILRIIRQSFLTEPSPKAVLASLVQRLGDQVHFEISRKNVCFFHVLSTVNVQCTSIIYIYIYVEKSAKPSLFSGRCTCSCCT